MKFGNLQITRNKKIANAINIKDIPTTHTNQQYTTPGKLLRSSYDNGFAPITSISDEVLKRNIHLGDYNKPELDVSSNYAFWNAMLRPNDRMGFFQFIDVLVAGFLSLDEFSLLVWHVTADFKTMPGSPSFETQDEDGNPTTEKYFDLEAIAGFTIVPNACKGEDSDGNEEWEIDLGSAYGGQQKFSRADIVTIQYSFSPDDGTSGVSPGAASSQEAAIQDRVNQYQRAFFDNGATPSIIVTIYARSHDEYKTIQQAYEKHNRGADKAQGVVYQSVIDNKMLEGMGEPKIEITTVGTANSDLALKDIVEFTERKITSNYSVSPIIYGDATTTTYQNQNLAKAGFMDTVQSTLVRLFASFENEIARICNLEYLPFTFVWDDVDIDITEEQKLKAEINLTNVRSFVGLQQSGASPEQAALALGLPDEWKAIKVAIAETPDVAPDAPTLNMKLDLFDEGCTCPEHSHNAASDRVSEKEQSAQKKILKLFKELANNIYDGIVTNATTREINKQIVEELTSVMQQGSDVTGASILNDIDVEKSLLDFSGLSQQSISRLEKRAGKVVTNYTDFVTTKLKSLDKDDPVRQTFEKFYTENARHRAKLIAQQETKNAYQEGELDVADNIDRWVRKNKPQSYIVKIWTTTSDAPCRFCKKMNGEVAGIQDSFVPGGLIESGDVTLRLDDSWSDGTIPDAHANCQCVFKFKLVSK